MAQRMGEPSASRTSKSKGVSPAIAVIVIVIVLALVAVVWLKFTQTSADMGKSNYQLNLQNVKPSNIESPEGKAVLDRINKAYQDNRKSKGK
jgi:uncharacterized protein HemX